MKIDIFTDSDQLVVALSGSLIKDTARQVLEELNTALASHKFLSVKLDFGGVEQIDCTALAVVLGTIQTISSQPLYISSARGEIKVILRIASGNRLFTLLDK